VCLVSGANLNDLLIIGAKNSVSYIGLSYIGAVYCIWKIAAQKSQYLENFNSKISSENSNPKAAKFNPKLKNPKIAKIQKTH
jgi:hypothetical protein